MFAPLIALVAHLSPMQAEEFRHDQSISLEFTQESEDYEGFGKVNWLDFEAEYDGELHLWTRSQIDLFLIVEDESGAVAYEDDNSGGNSTPFLKLDVRTGTKFRIGVVTNKPAARGRARLMQMALAETFETVKGVAAVDLELADLSEMIKRGELENARERVSEIYANILAIRGQRTSSKAALSMLRLITFALQCDATKEIVDATEYLRVGTERTHPESHPLVTKLRAREALARKAAGDVVGALELEKIVLAFRERNFSHGHISVLNARRNLAMSLLDLGDFEEAKGLLKWVLDLETVRLGPASDKLVELKWAMGKALKGTGEIAKAQVYEEQVVAAYEKVKQADDLELIEARIDLANSYNQIGLLHRARRLLELVFSANDQMLTSSEPNWLAVQSEFASLLRRTFEPERALEIERRVLSELEAKHPKNGPLRIAARAQLASSLHATGELEQALRIRQQVYEAYRRRLDSKNLDRLRAEVNLAESLRDTGALDAARIMQERLVVRYVSFVKAEHFDALRARHELGVTLARLGDLNGAHEMLQDVFALRKQTMLPDHPDLQTSRRELAEVKMQLGDSKRALALLQGALRIDKKQLGADHPRLNALNRALLPVLYAVGQFEIALDRQAGLVSEREQADPFVLEELLATREAQAKMLFEVGEFARATKAIGANVVELKRDFGDKHLLTLYASQLLAASEASLGQVERVIPRFKHLAWSLEKKLPRGHLDIVTSLSNSALAQLANGDLPGAKVALQKLVSHLIERTQIALTRSTSDSQKLMAGDRFAVDVAVAISESCEPDDPRLLFELVESRRLARTDSKARWVVGELLELRAQAIEAAENLDRFLESELRESITEVIVDQHLEKLTLASTTAEAALQTAMREQALLPEAVATWPTTKLMSLSGVMASYTRYTKFKLNETTKGFDSLGEHLLVLVLDSSGKPKRADLGSVDEIEKLLLRWRKSVGIEPPSTEILDTDEAPDDADPMAIFGIKTNSNDELGVGRELRLRLVAPLLGVLPKDPETLFVLADDLIQLVPLDALPSYGERVGDQIEWINVVSVGDLRVDEIGPKLAPSCLAITEIDYDQAEEISKRSRWTQAAAIDSSGLLNGVDKLPPLAGSRAEVQSIFDVLNQKFEGGGQILVGEGVSKNTLSKRTRGVGYIHFATHGWFAQEQVQMRDNEHAYHASVLDSELHFPRYGAHAGLAVSGANLGRTLIGRTPGILTIDDLSEWDLSSCELITLSGCNPNLDVQLASRGIDELRTALHRAGAKFSLISLWTGDSEATIKLMQAFYTHLWKDELPPAEALWKAKRSLRASGFPPRDWAGWILMGYTAK